MALPDLYNAYVEGVRHECAAVGATRSNWMSLFSPHGTQNGMLKQWRIGQETRETWISSRRDGEDPESAKSVDWEKSIKIYVLGVAATWR